MLWWNKKKEMGAEEMDTKMWRLMLRALAHHVIDQHHLDTIKEDIFKFNIDRASNRQILTKLQYFYGMFESPEEKIEEHINAIRDEVVGAILNETPSENGSEELHKI